MRSYVIKKVNRWNIKEYVSVNALAWRQSYKEIVNDDFLQIRCSKEEQKKSRKRIKRQPRDCYRLFLLEVEGQSAGMMSVGISCTKGYLEAGEIDAFYLLDGFKKQGFGKILFDRAVEELRDMGFDQMVVTCLEGNPSNDFYEHMGGRLVGTQEWEIPGQILRENIYFFERI